jgi:hypothetical protein
MSATVNFNWPLLDGNDTVGRDLWNPVFTAIDAELFKTASTTQDGRMTSAMYLQLKDVQAGAEVNQNAVSNVKVGATTITSTSKTSTVELASGSTQLTLTPDNTNKKVTFTLTTTSAGGTEANSLSLTNANGRGGDSERVGGQTLANLDSRYAASTHTHAQYALTTDLTTHTGRTDNPHNATAAQVGALALTGGTLTGDTTVSKNNARILFDRPSGQVGQYAGFWFNDAGVPKLGFFYDYPAAKMVFSISGVGTYDILHSGIHNSTGDPHTQYLQKAGGTLTNFLTLHADPTSNLHASSKQYVDNKFALALPLTGGTLTNFLTLHANPTSNLHAVPKQYADTKLALSGGTMTGPITLSADPANALEPATKQYVDNKQNRTSLRVYQATSQNMTYTTWTKVNFTSKDHDLLNEYDAVNSKFTCTTAGVYSVTVNCSLLNSSSGTTSTIQLYKNGVGHTILKSEILSTNSLSYTIGGSATIKLVAGDYLEIYVYVSGTGVATSNGNANTYLCVDRIN